MEALRAGAASAVHQTSKAEIEAVNSAKEQIIGLFVSAGYFKARVPGITDFAILSGGLAWGLSAAGLLAGERGAELQATAEASGLGGRVRLAEKLVKAMRSAGCPVALQANQISGLDWVPVIPAVTWLVTAVLEWQATTGQTYRAVAENLHDAVFSAGVAGQDQQQQPQVTMLAEHARVPRQFRRANKLWKAHGRLDSNLQVAATLLEYGERMSRSATLALAESKAEDVSGSSADRKRAQQDAAAAKAHAAASEEATAALAAREAEMATALAAAGDVSAARLSKMAALATDEVNAAAADAAAAAEALAADAASGALLASSKLGAAAAAARAASQAQQSAARAEEQASSLESAVADASAAAVSAEAELADVKARMAKLKQGLEAMDAAARDSGQYSLYVKLKRMLCAESALDVQLKEFKAAARTQMAELQAEQAALQAAQNADEDSPEMQAARAQEEAHTAATTHVTKLKAMLGRRNREIARLSRVIDSVPSRQEVLQYQKRIIELYTLMAEQLDELRGLTTSYNELASRQNYIARQEALLASVADQFEGAMKRKSSRAAIVEKMADLVQSVQAAHTQQLTTQAGHSAERESVAAEVEKLMSMQRMYDRVTRDITRESERLAQHASSAQ